MVFLVAILTGCAQNLDKNGELIASRAITMSTPWSLSAGWFDFIFVIPLAKGILFIDQFVGNVAIGVIGITVVVNIITFTNNDQINCINSKNAVITTGIRKNST